MVEALEGLAGIAVAQGQPQRGVRLLGTAEALREVLGTPVPLVERVDYERDANAARNHLGQAAFAGAWAEGRAMTPEQAVVCALEDTP